ncbi:MAG: glycoside hydrolase family 31 protein [Candidatus Sumerlaeia bacterium]|nr:glycoside hydrolase family 31 protein [Candidatus Sumerlaeia bacterium]
MAPTQHNPAADPRAIVVRGDWRVTVLTPRLFRIEHADGASFEDRATLGAVERALPVPGYTASGEGRELRIATAEAVLSLTLLGGPRAEGLIEIDGAEIEFAYPSGDPANLGGTTRTLDNVNGAAPLEPGVLSRRGWSVVDETARPVFRADGWVEARPAGHHADWYLFVYGSRFADALRDFTAVFGRIPVPPRYAFGMWWSRYWAYSDAELKDLAAEFDAHGAPLDVLVVDMDWHLEGWTGYTWNPACFPDPDGFLRWARGAGLRTALNLHPADGVGAHEAAHPAMAKALGHDLDAKDAVPFDAADQRFMRAYFDVLHRPIEAQGVDFWWIDWQQEKTTSIRGLDPLWWLNHAHWRDQEENPARRERPLILSRWGGIGGHRYPLGFSGDVFSTWESLAFQIGFTATAGNVGFAYWSHDIGGFQPGAVEPELYLRWVQWGALSPVLRTHGSNNPHAERRLWAAMPQELFEHAREAVWLRYSLLPYLYSLAHEAHGSGMPPLRPMYLHWPHQEDAYASPGQFMLGAQLLVAPVVSRVSPDTGLALCEVWLPPGAWVRWDTRERHDGGGRLRFLAGLEALPVFVRAGAIVPLAPPALRTRDHDPSALHLYIFPGERGEFTLAEDDGATPAYLDGAVARTRITQQRDGTKLAVRVEGVVGSYDGMPESRVATITVLGVYPPRSVKLDGREVEAETRDTAPEWTYDIEAHALQVSVRQRNTREGFELAMDFGRANAPHVIDVSDEARLSPGGAHAARGCGLFHLAASAATALGPVECEPLVRALEGLMLHQQPSQNDVFVTEELFSTNLSLALKELAAMHGREPDPGRRRRIAEAWCRIARVSPALRVDAVGEGCFRVAALLEQEEQPGFGSVDFHLPRVEGLAEPVFVGGANQLVDRRIPFGVAHVYRPADALMPARIRATAELTLDGTSIRFEMARDAFPSVNGWWLCGPFDNPWEAGLDAVHPPERGFDEAARFAGQGGVEVGWRRVERPLEPGADLAEEWFVDLNSAFCGSLEYAVGYALCWIIADEARTVLLAAGSDDGLAVFLDGARLHANHVGRGYTSQEDRVALPLRAGRNTLLLKISQGALGWGFCAHLLEADGTPARGVRVTLEPPA